MTVTQILQNKTLHDHGQMNTLTLCHMRHQYHATRHNENAMPSCINVIQDKILTFKSNPLNCQSFTDIHPFLTLFLGNLCRARCCLKHLPSKQGDHFMLDILASVFLFFFQYQNWYWIYFLKVSNQSGIEIGQKTDFGWQEANIYCIPVFIGYCFFSQLVGQVIPKIYVLGPHKISIYSFLRHADYQSHYQSITHVYQFT